MSEQYEIARGWAQPTLLASRRHLIMETVGKDARYHIADGEWRMSPETLENLLQQAFAEGRLSGLSES